MDIVKLGRTGLDVSRICLGCMSYGEGSRGGHPWALDEESSRPFYKQALDAGINFFDTANVYSGGTSEEFLGRALHDLGVNRDEVVIATKVSGPMRTGPNGVGLSRKAILAEVDHSLRRLGTDFIDLYQIHRLDRRTPMEEMLEALHDVVKAGKVRYLGASSMWAWEFSKALYLAEANGWTQFVSMQDHYNLLNREEEREMLPLCLDQGVGVIPWSPLARGRLARPWDEVTERSQSDAFGSTLYDEATDRVIVDRVAEVAGRTRRADGAGRDRVDAVEAGGHRAHHRRHQAAPHRRRGRGRRPRARRRRDRPARGAVPTPRGRRLRLSDARRDCTGYERETRKPCSSRTAFRTAARRWLTPSVNGYPKCSDSGCTRTPARSTCTVTSSLGRKRRFPKPNHNPMPSSTTTKRQGTATLANPPSANTSTPTTVRLPPATAVQTPTTMSSHGRNLSGRLWPTNREGLAAGSVSGTPS